MPAPVSVDAYLATLPEDQRLVLEGLRSVVRAAAPDAVETISYGMPTFKATGRLLVSYAAFKHHFSLFPASQAVQDGLGAEIAPFLAGRGTVRFAWDRPLPADLVTRIVAIRLGEVGAGARS